MISKTIAKRIIPMVLAGAAMLVLAMPRTASAHDWDHHDHERGWEHHDEGRHLGWFHHDRDDDDCDFRPERRAYDPNYNYYGAQPAYPMIQAPFGYGYGGNGRMNYLRQEWDKAEAKHQQALANGNRRAAKITSRRLWTLDRDMGSRGVYGPYSNGYYGSPYANSYYDNGYYNSGSALGQLGSMFGIW